MVAAPATVVVGLEIHLRVRVRGRVRASAAAQLALHPRRVAKVPPCTGEAALFLAPVFPKTRI